MGFVSPCNESEAQTKRQQPVISIQILNQDSLNIVQLSHIESGEKQDKDRGQELKEDSLKNPVTGSNQDLEKPCTKCQKDAGRWLEPGTNPWLVPQPASALYNTLNSRAQKNSHAQEDTTVT